MSAHDAICTFKALPLEMQRNCDRSDLGERKASWIFWENWDRQRVSEHEKISRRNVFFGKVRGKRLERFIAVTYFI